MNHADRYRSVDMFGWHGYEFCFGWLKELVYSFRSMHVFCGIKLFLDAYWKFFTYELNFQNSSLKLQIFNLKFSINSTKYEMLDYYYYYFRNGIIKNQV